MNILVADDEVAIPQLYIHRLFMLLVPVAQHFKP